MRRIKFTKEDLETIVEGAAQLESTIEFNPQAGGWANDANRALVLVTRKLGDDVRQRVQDRVEQLAEPR